jgi:hypothetical protein
MAATGVTETVATSIDVVAAILQQELIEKAVLLGTVSDYSAWVMPGANTVKIPRSGSFTASNKAENAATTTSALTFATDDIELNVHGHIVAEIEDIAAEQSVLDVESVYMERMASAMALYVDGQIAAGVVKAANDAQLSGASNLVLTLGDIVAARKALNEADVPQDDRFLVIPPAQEEAMLNLANFINADQYGGREALINGEIGRVLGFKIIVTNQLASDSEFVAYHRSHCAFARQMSPKFERARSSLTKLSDEVSLSLLFGVKQLDSGNRGWYVDETV